MSDSDMLWVSEHGPVDPPKVHVQQLGAGEVMYVGETSEAHVLCDESALMSLEEYE